MDKMNQPIKISDLIIHADEPDPARERGRKLLAEDENQRFNDPERWKRKTQKLTDAEIIDGLIKVGETIDTTTHYEPIDIEKETEHIKDPKLKEISKKGFEIYNQRMKAGT
jgi:hypothetical protein